MHATRHTCRGDEGREWEGSLLPWDQGWSLDMLHVNLKAKCTFAFGFQDLTRQVNSSSMLI